MQYLKLNRTYLKTVVLRYYQFGRLCKRLYGIARECKAYHSPLTFKYYIFLISYLRCYVNGGFWGNQVFQLGLGSFIFPDTRKYIGTTKMHTITNALNPRAWKPLQTKGIFDYICKYFDLPVPELYAVFFKNHEGVDYINSSLIKRDRLIEFIRDELPEEFVIKPCSGWKGMFLNIYTKTKMGIIDASGNLKTEQEIYESIMSNKRFDSFIVQERLRNHPYMSKIHASEYLHTIRIISLVDSSTQCKVLHAYLNLATGQDFASQQGSIRVSISLNDGMLEFGVLLDKKNGGFKKISQHPETGRNFNQFRLPFWEEILALTEKAAMHFLPIRTLGWDIAVTEKGVKILETNTNYLPPNYFGKMDKFIKAFVNET